MISVFVFSIPGYYLLGRRKLMNLLLLAGSLSFYAALEGYRIMILLLIILTTFVFSRILHNKKNKYLLFAGIWINVAALLSYKYLPIVGGFSFFTFLPLGLSFYTFQAISYLVDIYSGKINQRFSWVEVGIYLSFFPKILAGPIERAECFIGQLRESRHFNGTTIFTGVKIILLALVLKYAVSDHIGILVNGNMASQTVNNMISLLTTASLFSFQIFFDFYAYSILAIGVAMMYGINLSQNFNYPYFSSSFRSFWKRWNMTLTAWLRDYIYIPLGGNRVGNIRWIFNVLTVFIISGIWHNASLNFIIWGFLHGAFFITEHFASKVIPNQLKNNILLGFVYSLFVFLVVSLLWLVFKIENNTQLIDIFRDSINGSFNANDLPQIGIAIIIALAMIALKKSQWIEKYIFVSPDATSFIIREVVILDILIIGLLLFASNINTGFIYFKF